MGQKKTRVLALMACAALGACGGGSEPTDLLQGNWAGELTLADASPACAPTSSTRQETYAVSLNGSAVVVTNGRGLQLEGQLSGPLDFEARFATASANVDYNETLSHASTAGGGATVTLTISERNFALVCTRRWTGIVAR